jgi:colanic acid/amylovoran biosynthesis glycosyltransferase
MRIVHFRQAFSLLTETFIYDSAIEMERQGVDCHVLTLRRVDEVGRPFDKVAIVPIPPRWDLRRIGLKLASYWNSEDRDTFAWPLIRRGIDARLRELRPDAIHAHFGPNAVLIAPVAAALGIPLVATFHGYDFSVRRVVDKYRGGYRELFESASSIVGVSRHACDRLVQLGANPARVSLVRVGVRIDDLPRVDPAKASEDGAIRCIHIGRLVPKKSPVELVEAFSVAVRELGRAVDLSLTIVGDGPLRSEVLRKAVELGVSDRVHLTGALPHGEAMKLLAHSQICTQHSVTDPDGDQEGQPVSLVEAAAMGLPIVSTFHSGIPGIVLDGRTGYLVAEHDVTAMGRRIAALAREPATRAEFGAAARRHIQQDFSLERETTKLIVLLRRAAARSPRLIEGWSRSLGRAYEREATVAGDAGAMVSLPVTRKA